ncbi:hypothetical protein GCM10011371_04220 [Novosphingobium marinum]|uniref:Uncharacterized protein n=1 Tax=Novosphingobium marinum TaxID=1514948 RepID=A0A7Z0BTI5_9SPHN|nr:hypothetical protein [Novosphingobium marinum]NYH94113.1 hypothetical protein [Novosphingobium marinum]GGC19675.1 hypothetical protein GCM10011371_04220 [Novosphingobium marinum]
MAFLKGLIPGFLLTFVVAGIIGSNRSNGGWLSIEHIYYQGHDFYWSWPLFLIGTGISWAIFAMME